VDRLLIDQRIHVFLLEIEINELLSSVGYFVFVLPLSASWVPCLQGKRFIMLSFFSWIVKLVNKETSFLSSCFDFTCIVLYCIVMYCLSCYVMFCLNFEKPIAWESFVFLYYFFVNKKVS